MIINSESPHFGVGAPILETERLKLRGHRLDDFVHCAAMWADPIVTKHIGGRPFTEEESWTRLLRYVGHWALLGFGYWVVEEKITGSFIGEAGFADYKRDIDPPLQRRAGNRMGLRIAISRKRLCNGSCSRGRRLGRRQFSLSKNCLHH